MLKLISLSFNFSPRGVGYNSFKRLFLSNAYNCEEAWANRLKNPAFQKTDPNILYHELDTTFNNKKRVSVLDVDLLLNGFTDVSFKDELDDVLLRVRLGPEASILPERTTHAALRWYIQHASTEDLFNILSDRINYGLFPDYYLSNIMMDKFLKQNDPRSAVKIAVLQMLQEDFNHPIMKALALHCCYNYLESPAIWESYKEPEPDPDEEVVKVRVKYVRNPFFDDHFDITDTNHLVGKTLWLFGRTVDGPLGMSSELVGLVLYEKYEKCAELLRRIVQNKSKLYSEAVEKAREYALNKPKQAKAEGESEQAAAESGQEKSEPANKESVAEGEAGAADNWKVKVLELLDKVDKKNLLSGNLLSESTELVKSMVEKNESSDIKHQCEVYKQWEKEREKNIEREIEKARLQKLQAQIKDTKDELEKEEEKLFFFEREEEILGRVEKNEKEKASLVFYKGKGKHREKTGGDYIPPDVFQKKPSHFS